ncbi:putative mitochondrial protein [Cucumis melo var. makuwa]|uniref:Mitochondrial protein n=1 Tax=Cucumis melo var. makuwa TaxID=1194695 RepID=A0A5A7UKL0_CUCMM|nr:putative mitochondrial protein [Cucumis melo var. makuwa]TYK15051.1 putative mitochondrial protein [Cucumis melo var. makuwa]
MQSSLQLILSIKCHLESFTFKRLLNVSRSSTLPHDLFPMFISVCLGALSSFTVMAQTILSLLLMLNHVFSWGVLCTKKVISVTILLKIVSYPWMSPSLRINPSILETNIIAPGENKVAKSDETLEKTGGSGTKHFMCNYMSYSNLSPKFKAFTASLDTATVPKNIHKAMESLEWKTPVMEEMGTLEKKDDIAKITRLKKKMGDEFEIKDLENLKYFLGIEVARSRKGISASQRKYTLDLLKETGMIRCKPADAPMEFNAKLGIMLTKFLLIKRSIDI